MADQYEDDYDDIEETESQNTGKGLRAQLEKALETNKALQAQLSEFQTKARVAEVTEVLAAKGVNLKIAKFVPSDVTGEEAINAWLTDNADVFGFEVSETPVSTEPNVEPSAVASAKRIQSLGQQSVSPAQADDLTARIANAKSAEELDALLAEANRMFVQ